MPKRTIYHQALNDLGIQTWRVHRPQVFQGEVAITLEDSVRLIILSNDIIDKNTPFLNDILRSIHLDHTSLSIYPLHKISHLKTPILQSSLSRVILVFGSEQMEIEDDLDETTKNSLKDLDLLNASPTCQVIYLKEMSALYQSTELKRQLWKGLIHYVDNQTF